MLIICSVLIWYHHFYYYTNTVTVKFLNSTLTTLKELIIPYISFLASCKVPLCGKYIDRGKEKEKHQIKCVQTQGFYSKRQDSYIY